MTDPIALAVSTVALSLSAVTAWLTLFRKGTVRMTQPTVIFLGPETPRTNDQPGTPKVFLRTLLFATSKRGRIIESLHVSLQRSETMQNFSVWVYGDDKLRRGSGLFVGETGVEANHHFITHGDTHNFQFLAGRYHLKVYARLLSDRSHKQLFAQDLDITADIAGRLEKAASGVYFDWVPDVLNYVPHIESSNSASVPR
jgi:hypothetical protein